MSTATTTVGAMADVLIDEHDAVMRYLESRRGYGASGVLTAPSRDLMALERAHQTAERMKPRGLTKEIERLELEADDLDGCDCSRCTR